MHIDWLNRNGMVSNLDKTEMMLLNCPEDFNLCIDGQTITPRDTMKVLGVLFDKKMSWQQQVDSALLKTNRTFHGLRKIRQHLTTKQANHTITAYYFSVLYYGAECWFHRSLGFHLKQRIRSAHFRALRLVYGEKSRLDGYQKLSNSTTPDYPCQLLQRKTSARSAPFL